MVSGIQFRLHGTSLSGETIDLYATTNASGVAKFSNVLISTTAGYTLEEVDTANKYITPVSQKVVVEWNTVTKKSVVNNLKKGYVEVIKTAEDNMVEGIKFHLYGTSSISGQVVDLYATTNAKGVATFSDVPITDAPGYTLEHQTNILFLLSSMQKLNGIRLRISL